MLMILFRWRAGTSYKFPVTVSPDDISSVPSASTASARNSKVAEVPGVTV